jgi:hypothetical protein
MNLLLSFPNIMGGKYIRFEGECISLNEQKMNASEAGQEQMGYEHGERRGGQGLFEEGRVDRNQNL